MLEVAWAKQDHASLKKKKSPSKQTNKQKYRLQWEANP